MGEQRGSPGHVAFLRAVNVGGRNRLSMAELRTALGDEGLSNVSTVLQSGNVLFDTDRPAEDARDLIEEVVGRAFGLRVCVLVRTAPELEAIARHNPYLASGVSRDPATLHVAFLTEAPVAEATEKVEPDRFLPDSFVVQGREIYLSYPNGSGRSRLTLDYLERRLGTQGTARNWRTVLRLAGRSA
jgi:uncharacterized protein (DUF1697 family)